MKSLLPNNFKNQGPVDKSSNMVGDLGNFGQVVGKKNSPVGSNGFADVLMQAMAQDKQQSGVSKESLRGPSVPQASMQAPSGPSASDRQMASRLEQDLAEKRAAQPTDRSPSALKDRDDDDHVKAKQDAPAAKQTKAAKPDKSTAERVDNSTKSDRVESKAQTPASGAMSAEAAKDLRPLKMAVGNKNSAEAMVGNNAVLAFVTGRLDRLDPEGIPSIITGNPFLKQAASVGEINDLMMQPMAIADLCKMFEIDQTVVNKAVANGLDISVAVSPKDFLNAIGVDAGRVTSELNIMQQKLPLEGVQSYVERAKAMGQKLTKQIGNIEGIPVEIASQLDHAAGEGLAASQIPGGKVEDERSNAHPEKSVTTPIGAPTVPTVAPTHVQANMSKPTPAGQAGIPRVDMKARPQMASGSDLMESLLANRSVNLGDQLNPKDQLDLGQIIDVDSSDASLDPYAMLGQDMRAFQTDTTMFAPVTVGKSMANLEEQMAANGFSLGQKDAGKISLDKTDVSRELMGDRRSEVLDSDSESLGLQDLNVHQSQKHLAEGVTLAVEGLSRGSSGDQSSFQDSMSGGSEREESGFSKENLTTSMHGVSVHGAASGAKEFGQVLETGAANVAEQPKQLSGLHNKIMQHATMMLKDGGGSMRMNVDAPGMGKIDLAINLANNQLDVRILTPNDHVRDIINKELSGLRDGLGQQGISLRAVEVSNASQSSNQFAGGRFGQGHNGQQASYNDMKEYAQSFAGSFNPRGAAAERMRISDVRTAIPSSWMNSARDNSRINVRI